MRGGRGRPGVVRLALVYAALLASLCVVVWRQARALDSLRELDAVRRTRAVLAAERVELSRTLERLEGRSRVVSYAREELGMHVPGSEEIVLLRWTVPGSLAGEPGEGARWLTRAEPARGEEGTRG